MTMRNKHDKKRNCVAGRAVYLKSPYVPTVACARKKNRHNVNVWKIAYRKAPANLE